MSNTDSEMRWFHHVTTLKHLGTWLGQAQPCSQLLMYKICRMTLGSAMSAPDREADENVVFSGEVLTFIIAHPLR